MRVVPVRGAYHRARDALELETPPDGSSALKPRGEALQDPLPARPHRLRGAPDARGDSGGRAQARKPEPVLALGEPGQIVEGGVVVLGVEPGEVRAAIHQRQLYRGPARERPDPLSEGGAHLVIELRGPLEERAVELVPRRHEDDPPEVRVRHEPERVDHEYRGVAAAARAPEAGLVGGAGQEELLRLRRVPVAHETSVTEVTPESGTWGKES